ncbi:MAG TPA: hypothetical protein VH092_27895 [Urbifossiella sp.]|jgi:hypothetical protein|nr:hypothetical protein [Urbifossiella sp.]
MARARVVVIVGLLFAGCSEPSDGRVGVSGNVKLKGSPIRDGAIIQFEPLENQGTAGMTSVLGGTGNYTVSKANGLKPGKYLFRVTLGDGKTAVNPVDPDKPPGPGGGANIVSKDLVPPDWGAKSKQQVTVTADGPNTFDFDIP